jgi:hypothetical protein
MTAQQHRAKYGKTLDVHRLEPGSAYAAAGCVTLCRACHGPQPKSPRGLLSLLTPESRRKLATVKALSQEMGETFDPLAFVLSLVREPIRALHTATADAFCEFHTRRRKDDA